MNAQQVAATARVATVIGKEDRRDKFVGYVFLGFLLLSLGVGFLTLGALLFDVFRDGIPYFGEQVLTNTPSADPAKAGARPAILASLYLGLLIILFSVPLGVGTAVYLEEYAHKERWYNKLLELNIQNLAGVPSIVYGILGLAFIVRGLDLGRVLLAGALILTLLVLPTVIVASREAIRAVPGFDPSGRLCARRNEMAGRSEAGAAGRDPRNRDRLDPLGVARHRRDSAVAPRGGTRHSSPSTRSLTGPYTALPIQIFQWIGRPQEEFKFLAAAAIIVLLIMLLMLNADGDLPAKPLPAEVVTQ